MSYSVERLSISYVKYDMLHMISLMIYHWYITLYNKSDITVAMKIIQYEVLEGEALEQNQSILVGFSL